MYIDEQVDDKLVCTLTPTGKFSVPLYIHTLRANRPKKNWTDRVWNKFIPFRVNAFMWKIFSGALPVDNNIQKRGIALPSKCVCCANPKSETTEHLFLQSDIARSLWDHFAAKLHKANQFRSIEHQIRLWQHAWRLYSIVVGDLETPV